MRRRMGPPDDEWEADSAPRRNPFRPDSHGSGRPTCLSCTFAIDGEMCEYGFEFTDDEYSKEWLMLTRQGRRRATRTLFDRETVNGEVRVRFSSQLRGWNRAVGKSTGANQLLLSTAARHNYPQLARIHQRAVECWRIAPTGRPDGMEAAELLRSHPHREQLRKLLQQADLLPAGARASEDAMRFEQCGDGALTLATLLAHALDALHSGTALVVDDLGRNLHPRLTWDLVSLFKGASNPKGAQLVFTTHETSLLGDGRLELDEIWMTDRHRGNPTRLTPLTDYKLRSRDDFEKGYLQGRFGGVPVGFN